MVVMWIWDYVKICISSYLGEGRVIYRDKVFGVDIGNFRVKRGKRK